MGRWSRDEIEKAFQLFQETALRCGKSGEWREWADLFTEDATYVEHVFGTMGGREAIYNWIQKLMVGYPDMKYFPVEWYVIDEEKGWVVCAVNNRMTDPGDGSLWQEYNFTLLKYAGNMQWSYEEDCYNPARFMEMIKGWEARKKKCASAPASEK